MEPEPKKSLKREEILNDFRLAAKGDIERFKTLVNKRFGSSVIQTAMNLWHQWHPQIA
jgi:hypothetical protein